MFFLPKGYKHTILSCLTSFVLLRTFGRLSLRAVRRPVVEGRTETFFCLSARPPKGFPQTFTNTIKLRARKARTPRVPKVALRYPLGPRRTAPLP